jgi:hypothetical protein
MKNINSGKKLFEGKKLFDYSVHHRMPKIKVNKPRKGSRPAYKGIVNQPPPKTDAIQQNLIS